MNISRFKKLKQSRKENIGDNVADKVVAEWDEKRPTDLKELSGSIDLDNIKIIPSNQSDVSRPTRQLPYPQRYPQYFPCDSALAF